MYWLLVQFLRPGMIDRANAGSSGSVTTMKLPTGTMRRRIQPNGPVRGAQLARMTLLTRTTPRGVWTAN